MKKKIFLLIFSFYSLALSAQQFKPIEDYLRISARANDPLYTTSMIAGLVDKTAGEAWKIAGTAYVFEKQLQFTASYARYYTQPYLPNTGETDFDVTYAFNKANYKPLRGLSLRNRLGIMTGDPTRGTFYYDRIMLQYSF